MGFFREPDVTQECCRRAALLQEPCAVTHAGEMQNQFAPAMVPARRGTRPYIPPDVRVAAGAVRHAPDCSKGGERMATALTRPDTRRLLLMGSSQVGCLS